MTGGIRVEEKILLNDLIKIVKKYFWVILIFTILGGVAGRMMTPEAPAPTYEAYSLVLLEQKSENDMVINQVEESSRFFNTAQTLFNTPVILEPVLKELNLDMSINELSDQVKVSIENNSQILKISVSNSNAEQATNIANAVVSTYNKEIQNYLDVEKVKILEEAQKGKENQILHARPKANIVMGILIGLVLGGFAALILNIFFGRVKPAK